MTTAPEPTAAIDLSPPATHRRRRLWPPFLAAFVLGLTAILSVGVGALYAWGQQYDGRVLPGVRVGSTDLGGLSRDQAEAKLASDYGWLGTGQITLTGPDGETTTISYGDLGRGPDSSRVLDAAFAAGRQEPLASLFGAP